MFAVLRHYGKPVAVVNSISALYINSKSSVSVDWNISDLFGVSTGVVQDGVLTHFLFIILDDCLMRKATSELDSGVETHPRCSRRYPGKVINDLWPISLTF